MTLEKTNSKVEIPQKMSCSFETGVGLRQGDALSTLLICVGIDYKKYENKPRKNKSRF
jgi:hypothetical protein